MGEEFPSWNEVLKCNSVRLDRITRPILTSPSVWTWWKAFLWYFPVALPDPSVAGTPKFPAGPQWPRSRAVPYLTDYAACRFTRVCPSSGMVWAQTGSARADRCISDLSVVPRRWLLILQYRHSCVLTTPGYG